MSGWLLARAGLLPLLQSRVSMVYYVLLLLRCFSCSHTVLPKEHSLGVIFFSLHSSCYAVFFFNSLSSCPVYPLVIYVCCVWTGWWLISLVLVTSDNKGLLLLLLAKDFGRSFMQCLVHMLHLNVYGAPSRSNKETISSVCIVTNHLIVIEYFIYFTFYLSI